MIALHAPINQFNVGIYCRLSVDDGNAILESASISNQKEYLTDFVEEHGWNVTRVYVDDGYSGTNFERPGFKEMIHDIEEKRINTVITKDLSRLGRDYLTMGFYLETFFPDHDVRYIACNDGIDTFEHEDDFMPFKNIINEMYAKDVSKKIRFTVQNQIQVGKDLHTCMPLYGYMYDEKNHRIIDPATAPIVQKIFALFLQGNNYAQIAKRLKEEEILCPLYYNYQKYGYGTYGNGTVFDHDFYGWSKTTIHRILTNDEYTGNFRRGKTQTRFKSKKTYHVPVSSQYLFKDRYPPIISKEDFQIATEQINIFRKMAAYETINRYSGIAFCGCCGKPLRHKHDVRVNRRDYVRLTCRNPECTKQRGTILYEDLDKVIKKELMTLKKVILDHKDEFLKKAIEASKHSLISSEYQMIETEKQQCLDNITKIERYIKKAHEQRVDGILPEDSYLQMMEKYNTQKETLAARVLFLRDKAEKQKEIVPDYINDANSFVKYLEDLNPINCTQKSILKMLISKIYVSTDGIRKKRERMNKTIVIVYKHIDALIREFLNDVE